MSTRLVELKLRGRRARLLVEGVDTGDGDQHHKSQLLETLTPFWGAPITWWEVQQHWDSAD